MTENSGEIADEIKRAKVEKQRLSQANLAEMGAIAALGAQLDPAGVAAIRLDAFIKFIFARMGGVSDEIRELLSCQFEIVFEQELAESMKMVKAEIRKAQLAAGSGMSMQDISKIMRQNGHG